MGLGNWRLGKKAAVAVAVAFFSCYISRYSTVRAWMEVN